MSLPEKIQPDKLPAVLSELKSANQSKDRVINMSPNDIGNLICTLADEMNIEVIDRSTMIDFIYKYHSHRSIKKIGMAFDLYANQVIKCEKHFGKLTKVFFGGLMKAFDEWEASSNKRLIQLESKEQPMTHEQRNTALFKRMKEEAPEVYEKMKETLKKFGTK